jgi:hypothetical protein
MVKKPDNKCNKIIQRISLTKMQQRIPNVKMIFFTEKNIIIMLSDSRLENVFINGKLRYKGSFK